jgi:glycosyltransferase involved in cell wall biosynthesis
VGDVMNKRVAYVVRSWPRLSQTFVLNEALAVERLGTELEIFSMVRSGEVLVQRQASTLAAPVRYLDEAAERPWSVRAGEHLALARARPLHHLATVATAAARPGLAAGYSTSSSLGCLAAAVVVAAALRDKERKGEPVGHLHAHFAHDPALVALLVHRLTGIPFSFTAHARDLYGVPAPALVARAREASRVVTCAAANVEYLRSVLPDNLHPRVMLVRHGVDLDVFVPPETPPANPVPRLVSIGRLVEKKGFADLLAALARAKAAGAAFRCDVYGEGPLQADLERHRQELGLTGEVTFAGARGQHELVAELRSADLFALTPFVAADGDRDGVPNVVGEAMACGLPVVSTAVGGIPELVRHGVNGLLAPPRDVAATAANLLRLLQEPDTRARLGRMARSTVEAEFDLRSAAGRLVSVFAREGP